MSRKHGLRPRLLAGRKWDDSQRGSLCSVAESISPTSNRQVDSDDRVDLRIEEKGKGSEEETQRRNMKKTEE